MISLRNNINGRRPSWKATTPSYLKKEKKNITKKKEIEVPKKVLGILSKKYIIPKKKVWSSKKII